MKRVLKYQLKQAKEDNLECKSMLRQLRRGMRVRAGWGNRLIDVTEKTIANLRARRAWAIRRARWAIRDLNKWDVTAA